MLIVLCILWLVLSAFDAFATIRILSKHGVDKELNSLVRRLCTGMGIIKGTVLGIFLPTVAVATLCLAFHATILLAVLVGMRGMLALMQIHTLNAN